MDRSPPRQATFASWHWLFEAIEDQEVLDRQAAAAAADQQASSVANFLYIARA
jgi:hypothetical protein